MYGLLEAIGRVLACANIHCLTAEPPLLVQICVAKVDGGVLRDTVKVPALVWITALKFL